MFQLFPPISAVTKLGIFQDSSKLPGLLFHTNGVRCKLGSSLTVLSGCAPPQGSLDSHWLSRVSKLPVEERSREPIYLSLPRSHQSQSIQPGNTGHLQLHLSLQTKSAVSFVADQTSEQKKKKHKSLVSTSCSFNQFYNSFNLAAMCFFFAQSVQILEPYFAAVKFFLRRGPSTQKLSSLCFACRLHPCGFSVAQKDTFSPCWWLDLEDEELSMQQKDYRE